MLSEISHAMKDGYHMMSPIKWNLINKKTSEQNRTRDMETKNKLTVTRWGRCIKGEKRGRSSQGKCIKGKELSSNISKGHMDKARGG